MFLEVGWEAAELVEGDTLQQDDEQSAPSLNGTQRALPYAYPDVMPTAAVRRFFCAGYRQSDCLRGPRNTLGEEPARRGQGVCVHSTPSLQGEQACSCCSCGSLGQSKAATCVVPGQAFHA